MPSDDAPTPHVLLFATEAIADGSPTALLPDRRPASETLIGALAAKLRGAGHRRTSPSSPVRPGPTSLRAAGFTVRESADVATDLAVVAEVAATADGSVVLAAADIVAHQSALSQIASVRVRKTVAAVTTRQDVPVQPIMRQRDQVISVATHFHEVTGPNAGFVGLMAIGPKDLTALVAACERAARRRTRST